MELSSPNTQSTLLLLPVVFPPGVQVKSAQVSVHPPSSPLVSRSLGNSSRACMLSHFSHVRFFVTPWTVARQAPPSMGFSRQEHCSGLPLPSPGDLPDPGIEPRTPAPQGDSLPSEPPGTPHRYQVSFFCSRGGGQSCDLRVTPRTRREPRHLVRGTVRGRAPQASRPPPGSPAPQRW